MARYFRSDLKSLTDPMLYSSILHAALVTAVFFITMNYENSGTPTNDATTIEFNYIENTEPESSELYSAQTLPAPSNSEPTSTPDTQVNNSLADFFEQEKLQKIEEDKALALERDLAEKERLQREFFAQEQERLQQLEQERLERRRYQQQLQADIDAAQSKWAADLKAQSSSPSRSTASSYTGPYLKLSRSRSQIIGKPLSSGGCPATIINHEMSFSWKDGEVRDPYSYFTCTAEVGAATENTIIKNSASAYDKNGCAPDNTRSSVNILKTYMTAPFMNRQCDNGCTGQFECKNGKWEVNTFQYNDRQWFNKLEKTKPKVSEQYY